MKQIPKNWQKVKLGDVVDINPRQLGNDYKYKEIEYVDISSVGTGTLETPTKYLISEAPGRAKRLVADGDTVLSTVRPNRRSFYYFKNPQDNLVVSTGFAVLNPKDITDSRFLYYLVTQQSFTNYLTSNVKGSAYPAITTDTIENAEVIIPYFNEQKQIASILSAFDDKIEVNNKIAKTLEEMAQAIFKEWFIENSKIKMQNAKLSEVVKPQYGYTESAQNKPVGPKYLRGMDINKTSYIDWSAVPYCEISNEDKKKYQLEKGDIIVIRMADPGKIGIVEQDIDAVFASYLIRLKIIDDRISPYYLFYFLISDQYQNYIQGASGGTTRKSASAGVVTGTDIVIPPKELVNKFEEKASLLRAELNNLLVQNSKLRQTRDLLLPKLMKGEVKI